MTVHDARRRTVESVLILEDEIMLSTLLEELVRDLGAQRVHVCMDADSAEKIAALETIDVAVLDVNVAGGTSLRVADLLEERGVPFFFSTALGAGQAGDRHMHRPVLEKPFSDEDFKQQVMTLIGACQ